MKTLWILKTPGGEFIQYKEPKDYDWNLCSKREYVDAETFQRAIRSLERIMDMSPDTAELEAVWEAKNFFKELANDPKG